MTDQELRALVRDAVQRHLSGATRTTGATSTTGLTGFSHPSHAIYLSVVNTTDACVIEPAVPCNHCNYCKSHGF